MSANQNRIFSIQIVHQSDNCTNAICRARIHRCCADRPSPASADFPIESDKNTERILSIELRWHMKQVNALTFTISCIRDMRKFQSSWIASFSRTSLRLPAWKWPYRERGRVRKPFSFTNFMSISAMIRDAVHITFWAIFSQDEQRWSWQIDTRAHKAHRVLVTDITCLLYFPQQRRCNVHLKYLPNESDGITF